MATALSLISGPAWGAAASYAARAAAPRDRDRFLEMLLAYLQDSGGDILPCPENIAAYGAIFDRYLSGEAEGVVLLANRGGRPVGFTMGGAFPLGFLTTHGKTAMGWGTYVEPEHRRHGLARRLRQALDVRLREMGFETILGGYAPGNGPAEASLRDTGFTVYQVLGAKSLKE